MGRDHYRRSELDWRQAGKPEALVVFGVTPSELLIEVSVKKSDPVFAATVSENPLDNEHPDINSDGIQLHISGVNERDPRHYSWILVPEDDGRVRVSERRRTGPDVSLSTAWRRTVTGYQVLIAVPRDAFGAQVNAGLLDVIVNEIARGRERRRGQLVASGARGEWVYLRGDRQPPERYLRFEFPDV
jgi:hypothetical protein